MRYMDRMNDEQVILCLRLRLRAGTDKERAKTEVLAVLSEDWDETRTRYTEDEWLRVHALHSSAARLEGLL